MRSINGIITCFILCFSFCFNPFHSEKVSAKEQFKYNIEDIEFVAGVEEVFDINSYLIKTDICIGYTTAKVNIRKDPSMNSDIVGLYPFNTKIKYTCIDEEWVAVKFNESNCYISKKYISNNPVNYISYDIPDNSGFKSYMSYKTITDKKSKQYNLQFIAYTGNYGIRMVDDRYCVVLGSFFQKEIGTYFDLVLENGTIIKCILSDVKSSAHTYEDNIMSFNGCVSEFIVDSEMLDNTAKKSGDISKCNILWDSPVEKINIY